MRLTDKHLADVRRMARAWRDEIGREMSGRLVGHAVGPGLETPAQLRSRLRSAVSDLCLGDKCLIRGAYSIYLTSGLAEYTTIIEFLPGGNDDQG